MYERRSDPLISRRSYLVRVARSAAVAAGVTSGSLLLGVTGYHWLGRLPWIDSVLNASMILGGMGPVDRLDTVTGKVFASAYALLSGFALLTSLALLLAPIGHRIMHRFHLDAAEPEGSDEEPEA